MPTITISKDDISRLLGKEISLEELDELILYAKGEIDGVDGDLIKVDQKDTNRPDLWSTEGIVRQLRGTLGVESGMPNYEIIKSDINIYVDPLLKDVRPCCVNAVVKGLDIDEAFLSQIIQLQEKIALTFGRKRREVAVGIIDFDKITPPIYYKATKPDENAFIPLAFEKPLTPRDILERHPKGKEYRHLVDKSEIYPILVDSDGVVLTMPPIINSEHTGKVTTETKNIFIDVTGFNIETLKTALNVIVSAFAERGGKVYSVTVNYPDESISVPDMTPVTFSIEKQYICSTLGIDLDNSDIIRLLGNMRYDATIKDETISVTYLPYRKDIMHASDVIEDICIAYGYNNILPETPTLYTIGRQLPISRKLLIARELMIGLGFQEIVSFTLSNNEALFGKMRLSRPDDIVEIENPVAVSWSVLRNWLTPSLMAFLSKNTHHDYPQNLFEVSEVVSTDENKETMVDSRYKLAFSICHSQANYTKAREVLDSFMLNTGISYCVETDTHPSFLDGRIGKIMVNGKERGIIGEIHPEVIENWGIESPIAIVEFELEKILE